MNAKSFLFLFLIIGTFSYSQTNDETSLLSFGNPFGYAEEDSQMRINYFLGKPEEQLPTKNYSINLKNSESFFELCNCKTELVNPVIKTLKTIAPNLVYQEGSNTDFQIEVIYDLKTIADPKIGSEEISKVNTDLRYFITSKFELLSKINIYKNNVKLATYTAESYKIDIKSTGQESVDGAKIDWHNNYKTYLRNRLDYIDKTFISKSVIDGLKENTPKPIKRFKGLYTARFDKKNKKKHDFGTSDEHLNNVQNYINSEINSVGINNILTKNESFDKTTAIKQLQDALAFWKTQLLEKYAGETKYDDVRKAFAFNLLTTAFILKDKESFIYAKNYLNENKFSARDLFSSYKELTESYTKLQEEFLK